MCVMRANATNRLERGTRKMDAPGGNDAAAVEVAAAVAAVVVVGSGGDAGGEQAGHGKGERRAEREEEGEQRASFTAPCAAPSTLYYERYLCCRVRRFADTTRGCLSAARTSHRTAPHRPPRLVYSLRAAKLGVNQKDVK